MDENKNLTLTIDLDTSKAEKKAEELKKKIESANINTDKSYGASSNTNNVSNNINKTSNEAKKTNNQLTNMKGILNDISGLFGNKLTRSISNILNRITKLKDLVTRLKSDNISNINNVTKTLKSVSQTSNETADLAKNMQNVKEEVKEASEYASELQKQILAAAKASNDFEFDEDYDDGDIDIDEYNAMQESLSNSADSMKAIAAGATMAKGSVAVATTEMGAFGTAAGIGSVAIGNIATGASSSAASLGTAVAAGSSLGVVLAAVAVIIGKVALDITLFIGKLAIAKKTAELLGKAFKSILIFAKNVVEAVQAGIRKIGQLILDLRNKIISLGNYISKMLDVSLSGGDYIENVNLIENVFGDASAKIVGSLEEIRKEFGVDTVTASKYLGRFGLIMREMTNDEDELADKSIELIKRIGDVASQANYSFADVADDFSSGIVGMARPLDKYGINVRAAAIGQEDFTKELGKTYSKMSQAEKMQARYNKILKDSAVAAGDFSRTASSWNNVIKTIQNQLKELTMLIGQGLIVIFSNVAVAIRDLLDKIISKVKIVVIALAEVFNFDLSSIKGNVKDSTEGINDLSDGVEDLTKKVNDKKLVAGFDNLYSLTREASDSMSDLSSASNLNFGKLLNKKEEISLFDLSPEEEKQLDNIKTKVQNIKDIIDKIKEVFGNLIQEVKDTYDKYIAPHVETLKGQFKEVEDPILKNLKDTFDTVLDIAGKVLGTVLEIIAKLDIPQKFSDALQWISDTLDHINEEMDKLKNAWTEPEKEEGAKRLNTVISIGERLVRKFWAGIDILRSKIMAGVNNLLKKLSTDENFGAALDSLRDSSNRLSGEWIHLCQEVGNYIKNWLSSDDAVNIMTTAVNALSIAMDGLSKFLKLVQEWIPKLIEAYNKLPKGIKDVLGSLIAFIIGYKITGGGLTGIGAGFTLAGIWDKAKEQTTGEKNKKGEVVADVAIFNAGSWLSGGGTTGIIGGASLVNNVNKAKKLVTNEQIDKNVPVWAQTILAGTAEPHQREIIYNHITEVENYYNPGIVNSGGSGNPNASASSSKAAQTGALRRKVGQ